jgi:type II secretory pathway pseudopilin PulG
MIIIGILAAIAIPVFLNQRKKAVETSMKSDLRTVANSEESYFTDNTTYWPATSTGTTAPSIVIGSDTVKLSTNNKIVTEALLATGGVDATPATTPAGGYCSTATNGGTNVTWVYNSLNGGLQPSGTACP